MATNHIALKLPEVPVIEAAAAARILWTLDMDRAANATETSTLADIIDLSDLEDVTAELDGRDLDAALLPVIVAMIEDPSIGYPAREAVTVHVTPGGTDGPWLTNGRVRIIIDVAKLLHMANSSTQPADQWGHRVVEALLNDEILDLIPFLCTARRRLIDAYVEYRGHADILGESAPSTL